MHYIPAMLLQFEIVDPSKKVGMYAVSLKLEQGGICLKYDHYCLESHYFRHTKRDKITRVALGSPSWSPTFHELDAERLIAQLRVGVQRESVQFC